MAPPEGHLIHSENMRHAIWVFVTPAMDAKGNLYGTTSKGGSRCRNSFGCGAVYKVTP